MMYNDLVKIDTRNMTREEWIEHRKHSIGGSDAAAIVGLSKYSTPYSIWADKLGKLPPIEETEAIRLGNDFEDYVAKRFCEVTGKKVHRENNILINPKFSFAHANVDRLICKENAGLECKTTNSQYIINSCRNGEVPDNYYVQCVHYMMVTGAARWYIAVLAFGKGFYNFVIERNEEEISALANAEADFWDHVVRQIPPEADGSEITANAIKVLFPESSEQFVDIIAYNSEIDQLFALKKQRDELTSQINEIENHIKSFMGDAGYAESDKYNISFISQHRNVFDTKRFVKDHSGIDLSIYYKQVVSRPFKITQKN